MIPTVYRDFLSRDRRYPFYAETATATINDKNVDLLKADSVRF